MGLDMYLNGSKYYYDQNDMVEDGFPLKEKVLQLAYWRKHPNLHGYIVNTFANGIDKCQQIDLSKENILQIIDAIKNHRLPPTKGFFFGKSDCTDQETITDLENFEKALVWLDSSEPGVWKSINYHASW